MSCSFPVLRTCWSQNHRLRYHCSCWWRDLESQNRSWKCFPVLIALDFVSSIRSKNIHISFTAKTSLLLKNLKFRQNSHATPDNITLVYSPLRTFIHFQLWVRLQNQSYWFEMKAPIPVISSFLGFFLACGMGQEDEETTLTCLCSYDWSERQEKNVAKAASFLLISLSPFSTVKNKQTLIFS